MVHRPPFQLPTQFGTEVFPNVMQLPLRAQTTIDATKDWYDTNRDTADTIADRVTDYYSTNINHFVQGQRQLYGLGGLPIQRTQTSLPGLNMEYRNNNGQETLSLAVVPASVPPEILESMPQTDLNYDGYFAFVVHQTPPSFGTPGSYQVYLNGVLIFGETPPYVPRFPGDTDTGPGLIIVVAFGVTALRVHSMNDLHNPNNKKLFAPIIPPRKKLLNAFEPFGAPPRVLLPDEPGYFIYDWTSRFNPNPSGHFVDFSPMTAFVHKVIQYDNIKKSPLNPTGLNKIQVFSTPGTADETIQTTFGIFQISPHIEVWGDDQFTYRVENSNNEFWPAYLVRRAIDPASADETQWSGINWTSLSNVTQYFNFLGPLITSGMTIEAKPNQPVTVPIYIGVDAILAEFFSRHTKRTASQSWKFSSQNTNIIVNDLPLYWGIDGTVGAAKFNHPIYELDFDLSPKFNDPNTTDIVLR